MTFPQNSDPQLLVITIKKPDGDNHRVIKTKDGKWKIPVFYPFNTRAKFGEMQEVIRADFMVRDKDGNLVEFDFPPGQYPATVTRGEQKDGTDGGVSWNYYWKVSDIEIPNHAKNINEAGAEKDRRKPLENITKPDVQEVSTDDSITISEDNWKLGVTENELRIMRQTALKCASWQMVPLVLDFASPQAMVAGSVNLAEQYLHYFVTGEVPVLEVETPEEDS